VLLARADTAMYDAKRASRKREQSNRRRAV
jgi:hypothetical protein